MRHNPNSVVYNGAYINERMPFDVLSAVLERPSADGILRLLTYISFMRDPRAPIHVPDDVLAVLPPDPDIVALEQRREELKAGAYRIQGTEVEVEVRRFTTKIGSARTRRRNIISEEYRADYFRRRPIEDIEKQNNG
jgi:phage terminase small subunit